MATKKVLKKKATVPPISDDFIFYDSRHTFCCGAVEIGEFELNDAREDDFKVSKYDWERSSREINWSRIPAEVMQDISEEIRGCDASNLITCTTVVDPKSKHYSTINRIIAGVGFKKVRAFKGRTGSNLQMWVLDKKVDNMPNPPKKKKPAKKPRASASVVPVKRKPNGMPRPPSRNYPAL